MPECQKNSLVAEAQAEPPSELEMYEEEDWDPDGLAYTLEVARGMKSPWMCERTAAEEIWTAIANGKAHVSTISTWAEYVAKGVVGYLMRDDLDPMQRGTQALMALRLFSRRELQRPLCAELEMYLSLDDLTLPAGAPQPRRKTAVLVEFLRAQGHFEGLTNRVAAKRVERLLEKMNTTS
jgi:hypothetical protein